MSLFQFKQFSVKQDRCAMKIGTDAVLLGAWCPIDNNPKSVLDIGAGTGILSLMMAQRTNAQQIDAIEIEDEAYEQCVDNFESSVWSETLFCFHAGLDEFVAEPEDEYDLIICNPPFYSENFKSENAARDLARFEDALPFEELIEAADLLLSENGFFVVIIPNKERERFVSLCENVDLYPFKITNVKGTLSTEIKRCLMAFARTKTDFIEEELSIEISRHEYTNDYVDLTKDFYIKM